MAFRKPKDYDDVKVGGDFKILPADGYVCEILKAEETKSRAGKDMIKFIFDISEGDFAGYFKDMYDNWKASSDDPKSVKWPFTGTKWILLLNNEGQTNRDFKSFCTALEDSGTDVWKNDTFDATALKGAKLGIIFRREEQEYNGATSWRTVPWGFRSVKAIEDGSFNVPEDKALPERTLTDADSFSAMEDDIPF
jgi:hypothetical protein